MINIDFLPQKYRQHNANRKKRIWRFAIAGVFASALTASIAFQFLTSRNVRQRLTAIELQYSTAMALNERLLQLQGQLKGEYERARLVTFLKHRWPTTQLLTRVVRDVPESITFSRIHMEATVDKRKANAPRRRRVRRPKPNQKQKSSLRPAQEDFKTLFDAANEKQFVLELVGKATAVAELHQYVAALNADRLFAAADLSALVEEDFTIRLTVRPGYGLRQGPSPTAPPAKPSALRVSRRTSPN